MPEHVAVLLQIKIGEYNIEIIFIIRLYLISNAVAQLALPSDVIIMDFQTRLSWFTVDNSDLGTRPLYFFSYSSTPRSKRCRLSSSHATAHFGREEGLGGPFGHRNTNIGRMVGKPNYIFSTKSRSMYKFKNSDSVNSQRQVPWQEFVESRSKKRRS